MSDRVFQETYAKLNPEQKRAVDAIDGPVMVIAGPGTGKTTILTLRIANILRRTDTPAHGILAITYTDAGVKAMRQKLREVIGDRAYDVAVHTFHSFASAMIAEYPEHFLKISDFRQISPVEQESLIRTILTAPSYAPLRPLAKPDAYMSSIIRSLSDMKKEAYTPDMVREYARAEMERVKNDESNISTRGATKGMLKAEARGQLEKLQKTILFADVYERYEEEKRKAKLRDYDDLITELLVALREDELFLRLVQERFLYILVDEHQDTNDAQNFIVGLIAEFFETPNIFIVGDEKQAIYRFQGASVDNFLRLQKRFPTMQVISLNANYRSHQDLLDASFAMIEHNYDGEEYADLRVELRSAGSDKKRPVDIVVTENITAMENYLVEELKSISEEYPQASVALITRRNRELERLLRLLESAGIPVSSERSVDIFHHPLGAVFFDLIEYITDPSRIDALARTLAAGLWGLSFGQSTEVIRTLRSDDMSVLDERLPALKHIQHRLLSLSSVGAVIFAAQESGLVSLVARDPSAVYVWRGIVTLAESIARDTGTDNPTDLMTAMLAYRQSAEMKPVKVPVGAPDLPIRVMTAHGSKGLEFDYVFIPYATEDTWIGRHHGSSFVLPKNSLQDHDIRDLRRLFYVALTRARQHASVLYAGEESDGKTLTPLRFIEELHPGRTNVVSIPRAELEPTVGERVVSVRDTDRLLVDEAKKVLLESGLSVTALNHFLECPSRFLYESILKLPQAPSMSAEKGTAMHEAISHVWRLPVRQPEQIEQTIIESVTEHIDGTLLSPSDKEALKKELTDDAPAVARSLAPHFATEGTVSAEKWVETTFDGLSNGERITIPIHGKLDAIIRSGDDLSVFDYKTRQGKGMSIAAIKGETKNEDGNYFRQLVFYTLLLRGHAGWRNSRITTSLVFVSPDDKGRCPIVSIQVEEKDVATVHAEIQSVIDAVWSGRIAGEYCSDSSCKYCGYRKLSG